MRQPNERDRRIQLTTAPRFGIVGQQQTVAFRVEDSGVPRSTARVKVSRDGELLEEQTVASGDVVRVQIPIPHAGPNIV
jgi:hypothetical protein